MKDLKGKFDRIIAIIEMDYEAEKELNGENDFIENTIIFLENEFERIIKSERQPKNKHIAEDETRHNA